MIDLGTLTGRGSAALAVNNSGYVIGVSGNPANRAFSWTQQGGWWTLAPSEAPTASPAT